MLELIDIKKEYPAGDGTVQALKGVSLQFRKSEFVSILGPSGCGKTTMLNIIGGLDQYTSGDLVINGRSTKNYKDRDWDSYRNHSVGFVFQRDRISTAPSPQAITSPFLFSSRIWPGSPLPSTTRVS